MQRLHRISRWTRLALPIAALCAMSASAAPDALPRFASHVRTPIDCATTPFGVQVTLGYEFEAINLLAASGGFNAFEEYQPGAGPDPLVRSFQDGLYPGALAGSTFLKAVRADLDGDGTDEIVTANRTSGGSLQLGVFSRTAAPASQLVDNWKLDQPFSDVSLVAADLDGSLDDQLELGVLIKVAGGMRVHVLTGTTGGGIAQGDNVSAASWTRNDGAGALDLAAADLLLDGRAQLVVVDEIGSGGSRRMDFHLLEYQPTTSQLPIQPGDVLLGSKTFQSPLGTSYEHDNGNQNLDQIHRIEADAGDVVDGAAAELVVHTQFRDGDVEYIGRRLHHFTTERSGGAIIAIGFANRNESGESGREYDSSRLVPGASETAPVGFEATIADIDRRPPSEMIIARAQYENRLVVEGYKAQVDLVPGFTWRANGRVVSFTNTSTGDLSSSQWDFGDGDASSERSPTHVYTGDDDRIVKLTVTDREGTVLDIDMEVDVNSTATDGTTPNYMYHMDGEPTYSGMRFVDSAQSLHFVNVATGDLDRDGRAEILTLARDTSDDVLRSLWQVVPNPPGQPPYPIEGAHQLEHSDDFNSMTAMELVAADFDGDSIKALIGTDCRRVDEPKLHQVVWMPPYFGRLQDSVDKQAAFGEVQGGGESSEHRFGTYSSHDFSAYLGISLGSDLLGVDASVKATAGYNYQTASGQIHGTENSYEISEGFSQSTGEALVVYEENTFNCYQYDVFTGDGGLSGSSSSRLCEIERDSRQVQGTHARAWDTAIPAASPDHPPAQWIPLHREWSSVSLFRPATSNVSSFEPNAGPEKATDGLFDTAAVSASAPAQPWLQIDLGRVRDISNIRVFPATDEAGSLQGFRLYTSVVPMTGDGVPTGGSVRSFAPETEDGAGFDRWSIWTRDSASPYAMLRARYLRLQNPDAGSQPQVLRIAEVQAFGDVHVDPPAFPASVCDTDPNDERFQVSVWNEIEAQFRTIDVQGDLLWSGAQDITPEGCSNGVNTASIWNGRALGAESQSTWNMGNNGTQLIGSDTSFDSSTRVGAEFDIEAGFIATVQAGGAYEYTNGVTEEMQSVTYWSQGLEMGGAMEGFAPEYAELVDQCSYNARPYAFRLKDRSNVGYQHDIYVVDYIVPETTTSWDRDDVPLLCMRDDAIFADGFD